MKIVDTYPLLTVTRLSESRAFFVRHFGMKVILEASWVVMLSSNDGASICLGLMSADHPSTPPGRETFSGEGLLFTIQTDDAMSLHAQVSRQGVVIDHPLTVEAWGQRRFMVRDPSGLKVDVVEQIEPVAGFWEKYAV